MSGLPIMRHALPTMALLTMLASVYPVRAAEEVVPIVTTAVRGGISMLVGRGGNIGVSLGVDGMLVVDDQYASQYPAINSALDALSQRAPRFVINTHWHNDHTGSNELMQQAGAIIVAHDNVRRRLSTDQLVEFFKMDVPASATAALPLITFSRDLSFHFNGGEIRVSHVPNAHTDGDAIVQFVVENVIHAGDTFFNGFYPFIDAGSGGSVTGMIAAADHILSLADADTLIIPGHGPLGDRKALTAYRDMLQAVHNLIATLMVGGNSVEDIVAARPTAAYDPRWGGGFLAPDVFVRLVVDSITRDTLRR